MSEIILRKKVNEDTSIVVELPWDKSHEVPRLKKAMDKVVDMLQSLNGKVNK